ncbi:unnamed protein product [Urochloa humidicola]
MRLRVHSPLPKYVRPIRRANQGAVWLGWLKNGATKTKPPMPKKRDVMPLYKYVRPIRRANQCAVWLGWLKNGATWPGEPPKEDDAPAVAELPKESDAPAVGEPPGSGAANDNASSMDLLQEDLSSGFPESKSEAMLSFSQHMEDVDAVSKKKKKKRRKKDKPLQLTAQTQSHVLPAVPPHNSEPTLSASKEVEEKLKVPATIATSGSSYVASPPQAEKESVLEKAVHDADPLMEMPSIDQSPEKGDEKEKLIPKLPDPLQKVFFTKVISYLGRRFRIVLQDENGPCAFIAISNLLILDKRITLPYSTTVLAADLVELVFSEVFKKMKNEEYDSTYAAVKQSITGLDIDILPSSIDGFMETAQYKIFKALDIKLYHCWVLDLDLQEGKEIQAAVEDRSYDRLEVDRAAYRSVKEAHGSSSIESSARKDMDRKYDLIDKFFADSIGQKTDYGLFSLKNNVNDKELFVFFKNNHFSVMYKHNGIFFSFVTDAGYRTNNKSWQMLDDNLWDSGLPMEDILTPMDQMLNASVADYGSKTAKRSHMKHPQYDKQSQHHGLSVPIDSNSSKWHSNKALQHGSSSNNALSSSSSVSRVETRRSPEFFKAQFASFFTEEKDEKLGDQFLDFLRGYKENDIVYYEVTVNAMMALKTPVMQVFYEHIRSFDPKFAHSVHLCYERIRNILNHAARTFIQELNIPDFHCENPVVRICEMPQPERWIPVKSFFGMDGNKPAEAHTIHCGKSSMTVPRTTQVGRIIFTNALIKLSRDHSEGRSFNGQYTLDEVLVNDKLDVDIVAQYCDNPGRTSEQLDFVRLANDLLPEYRVDGKMPGYFNSLESSLRRYIDHLSYGADMMRKFHKFVAAHPGLKPCLTRLAVVDNIYSAHQSLSRFVKKLLQRILNSVPLVHDWRLAFEEQADEEESESRAAPIHMVVYKHHEEKQKQNDGKGPGQGKGDNESKTVNVDGNVETTEIVEGGDKQPFAATTEGGMIFLRHVRHHDAEGSMDDMGRQQLQELSELDLLNAKFFEIVLPAVLESLTYNMDNFRMEYGQAAYDELLGWLEEILEEYRRPEVLSSS